MKVVVHPKYTRLADQIRRIPEGTVPVERVFQDQRNLSCLVTLGGIPMAVKKYKRPTLLNCFIYSYFRLSKARRSYQYADRLLSMDFGSPEPIAYIEIRRHGFFHTGYFISEYLTDHELLEVRDMEEPEKGEVLDAFARFTARLHREGVIHNDFNLGNVFFRRKEDGGYRFSMIDINRLRFSRPSKRACIKEFNKLWLDLPDLVRVVAVYAQERGWNVELTCAAVLRNKGLNRGRKRKIIKHKVLGLFIKKYRNYQILH